MALTPSQCHSEGAPRDLSRTTERLLLYLLSDVMLEFRYARPESPCRAYDGSAGSDGFEHLSTRVSFRSTIRAFRSILQSIRWSCKFGFEHMSTRARFRSSKGKRITADDSLLSTDGRAYDHHCSFSINSSGRCTGLGALLAYTHARRTKIRVLIYSSGLRTGLGFALPEHTCTSNEDACCST